MRGYSDAKPDGKSAVEVKSLRRHFGQIYALNLDRNIQVASVASNLCHCGRAMTHSAICTSCDVTLLALAACR